MCQNWYKQLNGPNYHDIYCQESLSFKLLRCRNVPLYTPFLFLLTVMLSTQVQLVSLCIHSLFFSRDSVSDVTVRWKINGSIDFSYIVLVVIFHQLGISLAYWFNLFKNQDALCIIRQYMHGWGGPSYMCINNLLDFQIWLKGWLFGKGSIWSCKNLFYVTKAI